MAERTTAATDRVAEIIATYHDHVWARLPYLGPMAARIARERRRSTADSLAHLVTKLHAVLFAHLDHEDLILLAIAADPSAPDVALRVQRLRDEHVVVTSLLDRIRRELGNDPDARDAATPAVRALRAELVELDRNLREQIPLEEAVIDSAGT